MSLPRRIAGHLPAPLLRAALALLNPPRKRRAMAACDPRWLTLFITNRCNARCAHCFYWSELNQEADELDLARLQRMLGSLRRPLRTLRLSGGEPFLRRDLVELFRFVDERRIAAKMSIPTHGMLNLLPKVEAMAGAARHTRLNVSVSLDGFGPRHNRFRGIPGGFDKALANLRRMVELERDTPHFSVSVSIALARELVLGEGGGEGEGESEALRLVRFLREEVGIRGIGYDHVRSAERDLFHLPAAMSSGFAPPESTAAGTPAGDEALFLTPDEMEAVNRQLLAQAATPADRLTASRLAMEARIKRERQRVVDCLAGYVDCVVYPDGDVAVCEMTRPFANLGEFDDDLPALLHSPAAQAARAATRGCACTHPCHLSDSLAYDGDFLAEYLSGR